MNISLVANYRIDWRNQPQSSHVAITTVKLRSNVLVARGLEKERMGKKDTAEVDST